MTTAFVKYFFKSSASIFLQQAMKSLSATGFRNIALDSNRGYQGCFLEKETFLEVNVLAFFLYIYLIKIRSPDSFNKPWNNCTPSNRGFHNSSAWILIIDWPLWRFFFLEKCLKILLTSSDMIIITWGFQNSNLDPKFGVQGTCSKIVTRILNLESRVRVPK